MACAVVSERAGLIRRAPFGLGMTNGLTDWPVDLLGLVGLALPELGNLNVDSLVYTGLEFWAVAELEEQLEPDEERGEEDGLEQVVEQGRGSALELAVADKLGQPAHDVSDDGGLGGSRGGYPQVVCAGGGSQADEGQHGAGDRFKEHIEGAVCQGGEGAKVCIQVRDLQP